MSLADVFASVLDNMHLQKRGRNRIAARELSLHASRRAQGAAGAD
jgi:hypothetical protein